ncbi:MAG: FG-GAP-like repeat-containing protein [Verrucomicrobiota bacterium]|jgi:hypothetical protein
MQKRVSGWRTSILAGVVIPFVIQALAPVSPAAAGCLPPPAGLIGWWAANGDASDVLGIHNGSLQGGVAFTAGESGSAFEFDGTNSFVQIADAPELSPQVGPTGELTLEAWVKILRLPRYDPATSQPNRAIAVKGSPGQWEYGLYITTNALPAFGVWQANGNGYAGAIGNALSTNVWHHLAGVLKKGQFGRIYVDGQLAAEDTSFSGDTSDGSSPLYLGRRGDGQFFDGQVDEVSLYGRALAASEISAIFNAGAAGKCAVLAGASVPYFTDFEAGAGPEWMQPLTDNSESLGFTRFSGRFNNGFQMVTLTNLVPGQAYTVGFDLYLIDSWDGNGDGDYFNVNINGTQLFHQTFSNYNGNPPNSPQSYPGQPDEGRANFGFNPSWVDAIYRNVEIPFIASNAIVQVSFGGQGLEDMNNESWGLDNVGVRLTSGLTNTFIRSTTLPPAGTTNSLAIDSFIIAANWPLLASTATNPANFVLTETGSGLTYPLVPTLPGAGGRSVALALANQPLQPGHYVFQTTTALQDTNANPVPVFTRGFYLVNPLLGSLETPANDLLSGATPLPTTESPVGSRFFTAFAVGLFASTSDVDYWRFDAEAGDVVTVRLESESQGVYPHLRLRNASDQDLTAADGDYGGAVQIQDFTISAPGTYYLRAWSANNRSRYWMRLDQSRGPQMESEDNGSQGNANPINFTISPGLYQGQVVGALPAADSAGDFWRLGNLNIGNVISATALFPTGSTLTASQIILSVQIDGNAAALVTNLTGNLSFNVPSNGLYYLHVETANRNLRAQYLLNVAVSDTVPPVITGLTLPGEGTTTTTIIDRVTLSFSEDINALAISNSANYELRGAGPDGLFGTSDDSLYTVATTGYSSGLSAAYTIADGPLQPGAYRFTVGTNLTDRAGNKMAAPFVRNFTVANLPGYVLENRNNDAAGLATPLSFTPGTNDGTIGWISNIGVPSGPQGIAAGHFNHHANLDLATANWNGGNVSVLTNNGQGVFGVLTNIATGGGAVGLGLADFNNDGLLDIAVANYNAGTVTVLLGNADGTFQIKTNIGGFSGPYYLVAADLDGDGKIDLAVPNANSGTVSVLLGNGDGTFQTASNYTTGSSAMTVAVGDLNGDGKPDLAVANAGSATISVLTNLGHGTFQLLTNIAVGPNPRGVAIGDVTGDGVPDLVVLQSGDNSVGVLAGNGNGSFGPRRNYYTGTQNAYQVLLADLNGDGRADLVVPGYGNNVVGILLNNGNGIFTNLYTYGIGGNPIGVAAGDFNQDGRTDLAFEHYYGNYVSVWAGNPTDTLPEDPPGSGLRTAVARGTRSNSGDADYYQFSGNAGDQVILAVDVPGNPGGSGLYYQLLMPDGSQLTSFYPNSSGWGQSGVVTLPQTGTYFVRVSSWYDYQGEYRVRVTLARPPLQLNGEGNTSLAQANPVTFNRVGNHLQAAVAGYVSVGNGGGDFYSLGYLAGGATLNLSVREPASSGTAEVLWVYNASGVLMTNSLAGATNLAFTLPVGQAGLYYVQVTAAPAGFAGNPETVVRLSGGSDYLSLGNWFNYQTFTLSMWVDPGPSQNAWADLLDDNHQGGANWVIEQNGSTANQYYWFAADGSTNLLFNLAPNTWQHLDITRDATNINRVYINGLLAGQSPGSGQINYDGNQFLRIGAWGGGGRNWRGLFDELRVWNRALSQPEIIAGLTGSLTGHEPDLAGYWPLDEGFGTNSADLSPSNHPALFVNGPAWAFVGSTNAQAAGLVAQYVLTFDLTNPTPPAITAVTLPPDSSTTTNILTSFTVGFSQDMDARFSTLGRNVYRFNGHSYLLTDYATTWGNAEALAVSLGGHLASITNAAENSWISQQFSGYGDLWIGLNALLSAGTFVWTSGAPFTYSNWASGEPNNYYGYEPAVKMYGNGNGAWADLNPNTSLRGVMEVTSTSDADGDGLVDSLDPYPNDPLNAFDLRAAGPDGVFDTADDIVYHIYTTGYSGGLSAAFAIADGPLEPGGYRFKVTTSLTDRFGNPLPAPYLRYFTVAAVSGLVEENRRGAGGTSSTSLSLSPGNQLDGSFSAGASAGAGSNPYFIVQGFFKGDTNLDLVTANLSSGNITVFRGDGAGNFQAATNIPTGNGPISLALGNFNSDTNLDLAVANYYGNTVSILLGDGAGSFSVFTNYSGFSNPRNLATADLNKDGKLDLVVPNSGSSTITVLFGNGDGTFQGATNYTVGSSPQTVAVGDLNGDGQPDLVTADYNSSTLSILLGSAGGTFQLTTNYATPSNPRYVALGDVNGDGRPDLIAVSGGYLSVFLGNGDGTFQPRTDYSLGGGDCYQVTLADLNGDGMLDAVIANFAYSRLSTLLNNGDGTFGPPISYGLAGSPISATVGDFNHDGRLDIATANYYGNNISILLGNNSQTLTLDPAGTGLRIGGGRGNLADSGDLDYWSFSAQTGDRLFIAAQNPGDPGSSQLLYRIYNPDWSQLGYFYTDGNGRGQVSLTVPASGTYTIRVEPSYYQYYGEYRFRVTLARPPVQLEVEDNSSLANANAPALTVAGGRRVATVLGYFSTADVNGDYYQLGNLAVGTQISLSESQPASSSLAPQLELYNAAGVLVTNGWPGQTNLVYTIGPGNGGAYYAHIVSQAYLERTPAITNALYFNGANNYINVGNWSPGPQWSIQAWVMPVSLPGGRHAIAGSMGGCLDWAIVLQDGKLGLAIRPPGGCNITYTSPGTVTPGSWYHVAGVSDGTNSYLYVNGVLAASGAVDPNYTLYSGGTWIGGDICCGEYFPGFIQDVSIWNRALSAGEVAGYMASSPSGSEAGLSGYWRLLDGAGTTVPDLTTNGHNGTLVNGPAWSLLSPLGTIPYGIFQQYLLGISLLNTIPPQIVAVSLPAEGTTSSNLLDNFAITFSEDMGAGTVTNSANYEMRCAGADNLLGTADDVLYTVVNLPAYTAGTGASYAVTDGPLQPGLYRFTIKTNLTDPVGTFLPAPYVRNFAVANIPGFVLEKRFDNSAALATTLSLNRTNRADGSFHGGASLAVSGGPEHLAAGRLNADTNLDLAVALWSSGSVAILLGNGDGTFQVKTNYATGNNALSVALGNFNADTNLDLAVANYGANTVTILLGNGDGTFQVLSNYNVGANPYGVVTGDFNHDGKTDLAVANYSGGSSGTVSILLGNGDGTFQPAVNYPVGHGPLHVAVGDVNGDGKPDLVVANYYDDNVSVLFGNGDGTFAPAVSVAAGYQPRAVVLADLNKDGKLDLAVFNGGDNTVSVMFGNGDGSFQPRINYPTSTSDGVEMAAADVDGDGWPDLVVNGYNNGAVNVLLNRGDGTLLSPSVYSLGARLVGLAIADFNNDGRLDLAVASDNGNFVSVLLGNDTQPLPSDAATGLRITAGRGDLLNGSQSDYWSFDALAGDRVYIACENPGNPGGSALQFVLFRPDGSQWANFVPDYNGRGQWSGIAPATGAYTLRIDPYYQYAGEYRFRVTLASPPVQVESENNDSIGSANSLTFALSAGHRQATVLGYIGSADGGDFFGLGYLSSNSVVTLNLQQPASSGFADVLEVYNSAGTLLAGSAMGATNLTYTVSAGRDDAYYARVRAVSGMLPPSPPHPTGSPTTLFYGGGNAYSEAPLAVPASALAVSLWFRTSDPSAALFSVSDGGGGHDRHIYLNGGNIYTRIYSAGTVGSTGLNLADGAWHYVVLTYGSAIGGNQTYVDGVPVASGTKASSDFTSNNRVRFGYSQDAPHNYLVGYLDEVRIWNYAFAAADVLSNMTKSLTGSEAGLLGYWRFNEGAGLVSFDRTTNANNATLLNGPVWAPAVNYGFSSPGIFAQYLLSMDTVDTVPPAIASVTLPAAGSTNLGLLDHFTLGLSKSVDPALNALNRYVRLANGHAYTVTDSTMSWYNAETQARTLGGHLATINDAAENAWVLANFGALGNLWLGLTDEAQKGLFLWASGDPVAYTNWSGGAPINSDNRDYTYMKNDGTWANEHAYTTYRGVIEVGGPDADGDGLPDTLDPFPSDPYNVFDLRAAGPDGLFDTPDDQIYHLTHDNYTGGLSLNFALSDGPLQPGYYRFMVTTSLRDLSGNPMAAPFIQYFAVGNVPGYVMAGRTNNSPAAATPLPLAEDPPGVKTVAARGNLFNGAGTDYWSFGGTNGDLFNLATFVPGSPGGSGLHYQVFKPDGSVLIDLYPSYYGDAQSAVFTLPATGAYLVAVSPYYSYAGEYRFRITSATPPLQMESEDNGSIPNADVLAFNVVSNTQSASIVGNIRTAGDLDYFNLGTVSNGYSIFLSVRLPASSALAPVVSVYDAAGVYQEPAPGSQPQSGLANVPVTATGTYYAVVRAGNGTGGLKDQYVLDVNIVPTGSLNFPNLVASPIILPAGLGILSGQPITYSFTVQNFGPVATAVANWLDRAVLSTDQTLGNADDIPLGLFPHSGLLDPGASYSVTNTFPLPDGISGDFYIIVQADAGDAVNEYLFAGNKTAVSTNTFHVSLAPYPDLTVEGLHVTGPDSQGNWTIAWNTANRGNGPTPGPFSERLSVRNQTTGISLVNTQQVVTNILAPNDVLPHLQSLLATNAGVYQVQVTTDAGNSFFEDNTNGPAAALANNTAPPTSFQIVATYNVSLQSSPAGAGTLSGAGSYTSGSAVTVTATPNTNSLPYQFVNWTEGGAFESASASYAFLIARDRALVANFTLPTFLIAASNNPPAGGTVSGQGSFFYGATNVLAANANFGYRFTNWTENGSVIATTPWLTNIVTSNRFVVANYVEANTIHVVTTGTSPTNLAAVSGAGSYTNGQTAAISAPLSVTNPPNIYNFRQFRLNGTLAGASASFSKTFSTLDPTNMQYLAFYDAVSILPLITNVAANYPGLVPATTNFLLTLQFNRSMNTNFTPLVVLTNPAAPAQAVVPPGGAWNATAVSNDTFRPPPITFATGMDGTNSLLVSLARDLNGNQLTPTNVAAFTVDVTPPPNPVLALSASNTSSATVSWASYSPPSDLNGFRAYLSTNSFTSVTGLTAVSSLGFGARSFTYYGLSLDRPYYVAIVAVDNAGNANPAVASLAFTLPTSLPPPVLVQVTAVGSSSAGLSWNSYDTSLLLGFAGFQLYYETTNFTSVTGHALKQTLGPSARSVQIDNLDRTRTYYFAVVGFNGNNAFNPNVTTASWSDPYAGSLALSTTIGGAGQGTVDILQSITVVSNAVLTIPPGTRLRFAPGTSLTIQQGALNANGTPLDPIVFTSANDQPGLTPAAGDWNGVFLGGGAGSSVLRHVFVNYGAGLTLSNCAPTVDAFTASFNTPAGLTLTNGALLNTTNALLTLNGIGAQQLGSGQLGLHNSVIRNNGTNALALGGLTLSATGNWWGSATPADIDALLQGAVDRSLFLTGEPLLTPAIGTVNNVTQVGSQSVNLRLACRTADGMRLSEDSTFAAVFFAPFAPATAFQLSNGGGQKTVFAQFRSITGQTSAPVAVTVTYITAGPTITAFNVFEGEVFSRPLNVTGSASAPLGMAALEFYVDGLGQATNSGANFSLWFDMRNLSSAVHRVKLLARDNSGNFSTLEHNVVVAPTPPPAPVITAPAADLIVNSNSISLSGTAEPFIPLRLFRSGSLAGTTNAAADGSFGFPAVALVEGANSFTVLAVDALGSATSPARNVSLDTMPPAQPIMDAPNYVPGLGLTLQWHFAATGKRASTFQVFWSTAPLTNITQASGASLPVSSSAVTVQGLATANYYFYVVGFDALGNQSPLSAPLQYYFDAVPPAFSVSFSKASPVGVGPVHVTLSASKALNGPPLMTVAPAGNPPSLLPLTNTALNTYESELNVTALLPSGPVRLSVSAVDLAGNPFNGAPSGPPLVIDVTPPAGVISTAPLPPVQTTNSTNVAVGLQLTKPPAAGTTPTIGFGPPTGSPVPVTMSGTGTNWAGTLTLTPAMGSGIGHFTLTVTDSLNNVGHSINSGSDLELYNTALPTPPGQPVHFEATSLAAGRVLLTWSNVPTAEIYRVYSQPGTNYLLTPTNLVADNVSSNSYIDLPAADGYYLYAVTALRRGAEGTNSIVRVALSDRTPPPAPTNVVVQLAAAGLQITWQPGAGQPPDHYNVYRNGALLRTVSTQAPVLDNPPRGVMSYVVSAADALGNEAMSDPVTFLALVGAVNNLQLLATQGQASALTWTSADTTAVGFNVYRNGLKQNTSPLAATSFTDSFPLGALPVTYAVTAVNSTNAESAARSLTVFPLGLALSVNGGTNPPMTTYFDDYRVAVSNLATSAAFPLQQVEIQRLVPGANPYNLVQAVGTTVGIGNWYGADLPVPGCSITAPQSVRLRAVQQTDAEGSSVIYQQVFSFPTVQTPASMVDLSANQLPLAGGLNPFNLRVYNRGYEPMYLATTRANGSQPGDLYVSVLNQQGQEVSRTPLNAAPPGITFANGVGYVIVPPGGSTNLTVPAVLVPASLASNTVTFQAVASAIYDRATASGQQQAGPLAGSMQSALSVAPYYATAQTDKAGYSNDQPILISGQALDSQTGQPVPNVPLQIGFATRGYHWSVTVTNDSSGNYAYTFNPPLGLAGTLMIWAAHPSVVDQLNQVQVTIYRFYAAPATGDIRMSKNDSLQFNITLINPGDVPLTGFTVGFQAYQMQGTNQVAISTLHGTGLIDPSFTVAAGQRQTVTLQLTSEANAPDNAIGVFTLTSAQGAAATFTGNVTLLPAVPIITVLQPDIGYVEVSLDRGSLKSQQVTVQNGGLKDLQGVTIIPPTNITWMIVNLPAAPDGSIHLPDLAVGQSNSFTVVFTPPTNTPLAFYQDKLTIQGTNAQATFDVRLYARVTSSQVGAVQFYVEDMLTLPVPNATVNLRNTALQVELPPVQTDINGLVTVTNLQEGDWSWQIVASGYSAIMGVATVIADQTINVAPPATRLARSLVTVNFTVTPVPYTDRYEITIEQTFETHVPAPVLVVDPAYTSFDEVKPGFEANFIVTAYNHGLIALRDVAITGSDVNGGRLTPLIDYLPLLLPEQSVEIPFRATYSGTNGGGGLELRQGGPCDPGFNAADCLTGSLVATACGLLDLIAIFKGVSDCPNTRELFYTAAGLLVGYTFFMAVFGTLGVATGGLLGSAVSMFAGAFGCLAQWLAGFFAGGGAGGTSGGGGPAAVNNYDLAPAGCFAAETRVLLADGRFKTIDQVQPGDVVRSGTGRAHVATVSEIHARKTRQAREIRFHLPGDSEPQVLRTTDEHFFWVDGKGWKMASQLAVGDWLFDDHDQRLQITANQRLGGPLEVYTFKLRGDMAFYANGVLVHDLCGSWTPDGPVITEWSRTIRLPAHVKASQ